MRAVPAVMRMESRGFKLDVEAHARLIAELKQEREAAEQEYREACLETGHDGARRQGPFDAGAEGGAAHCSAFERRACALAEDGEDRERSRPSAANSCVQPTTRQSRALVKLAPHRQAPDLLRRDPRPRSSRRSPAEFMRTIGSPATASGRATCSGPNLQQIPRDKRFRALFIPEPGNVLIAADYTNMELRAAAHISGDRRDDRSVRAGARSA